MGGLGAIIPSFSKESYFGWMPYGGGRLSKGTQSPTESNGNNERKVRNVFAMGAMEGAEDAGPA
jgi:hypothetical protein